MSAATEQQNNGDVAVEKVTADAVDAAAAVKEDLKKPAVDETVAAADNGTASKGDDEEANDAAAPVKGQVKGTKRPAEAKSAESKKAKKEKAADADSDDEEVLEEITEGDSEIESDEYDIPYDGEEEDLECDDDDDDNDDGSGSDDQA
ncbi:bacchus [Bactrocera oleae]|uniref:bacchus n=1 Tax=Bactrocera oleae TaxID=104688 RepID=UPI0006B6C24B|nr:bacchus [Bactrocera oleae]XP_036222746.1 bacchus [Bactrocera oleae]XP_036222747.1 bacchus [Bactrocera oleae]